jgi:Fibronectin type III domain
LNLPAKGASVAFREPLNIIFNWTPRHMGSPNAAFQTEYEFTLVELWDTGVLPEAAFGTMPPLYQTTTQSTTLLYGPAEPPLLPGKRYAWRIRAKAKQGADEFDVFLNNGYTEIFYFTLQEDCQPPQQPTATVKDGRVTITWVAQPKMFEYLVEYREAGKPDAQWFNIKTTNTTATIQDAVPGRKYEYRVGGSCSLGNTSIGDTHGFEMPAKDTLNQNCGLLPDIRIVNQTPIQQLQPDEQIMAGDFPVRLMQVKGAGSFSGKGYITIPFLGYNRLKVKFDNIKVNTDRQLIDGVIITTFDPKESQVVDVDSVVNAIGNFVGVINDLVNLAIDDDYLTIKELADKIREMAEEELPQELKDKINKAADNLEQSKKDYDDAKAEQAAATTPEQRTEAQKKIDAAEEKFDNAKDEVKAVTAEKAALVKAVTDVVVKAIKDLKDEAERSEDATEGDFETQRRLIETEIYTKQSLDSSVVATGIEDLGGYEETLTEDEIPAASKAFAKLIKDYDAKQQVLLGLKLIFALSDYYKDDTTLSTDFKNDLAIQGKVLIREIMDMKTKNASTDDMVRHAKEYLKDKLDNLLKQ